MKPHNTDSRQVQEAKSAIHAHHAPTYRRIAIGLLAVLAFLMTIAVIGFIIYGVRDHNTLVAIQKVEHRQNRQLIEGCERLNVQRATNNQGFASNYHIAKVFYLAIRISKPMPHTTREQKVLKQRFLRIELEAIRGLRWVPLTNCKLAVAENGVSYKTPLPVHFYVRQPPESALSIENAGLLSPLNGVTR